ncbi:hypothetical protein FJZ36_01345 [Candidatus Poribacteria bacterium]|nr:hypothetical protein [Candidatus Poribacteria bacterium]
MTLVGRRIALVIADGYHEHEFWYPYYRFREEGAEVTVAGVRPGVVHGEGRNGRDGLAAQIAVAVADLRPESIDCLYLPGGIWAPLALRVNEPTLELTRQVLNRGGIVAAICHASWVLVSAGVVRGRRIACPGDMSDDVRNACGEYVADGAVQDGNLITAVYFAYLPEHLRLVIPAVTATPIEPTGTSG